MERDCSLGEPEECRNVAEKSGSLSEEYRNLVEESRSPVEINWNMVEESKNLVEESTSPAEENRSPAEENRSLAEENTSPAKESGSPAEESGNLMEESRSPENCSTCECLANPAAVSRGPGSLPSCSSPTFITALALTAPIPLEGTAVLADLSQPTPSLPFLLSVSCWEAEGQDSSPPAAGTGQNFYPSLVGPQFVEDLLSLSPDVGLPRKGSKFCYQP